MTYSFRTNGNFIDFVHTDDTSLQVESVLRSLHNTSRCITWSLPEDTTRISFVVDDIRVDNFPLTEIDFDGVAIDSQDDFETGITAMFPGLAGGGSPGSSYLVYTALLNQSGTGAPVATVLGTPTVVGAVTTSYVNAGSYRLLNETFISGKVACFTSGMYAGTFQATCDVNGEINLLVTDLTGTGINDYLANGSIEIRVYP